MALHKKMGGVGGQCLGECKTETETETKIMTDREKRKIEKR